MLHLAAFWLIGRLLTSGLLLSVSAVSSQSLIAGNLQIELNEYERKLATAGGFRRSRNSKSAWLRNAEDDTCLLFEAAVAKWLGDAAWRLYPFNDLEFGSLAGIVRWPQTNDPEPTSH